MTQLLFYAIAAFGLAYIIGFSTITLPLRIALGGESGSTATRPLLTVGRFGKPGEFICSLIECPACFGFWTGLIAGLFWPGHPWYAAFGLALFTSGSNFILGRATRLI